MELKTRKLAMDSDFFSCTLIFKSYKVSFYSGFLKEKSTQIASRSISVARIKNFESSAEVLDEIGRSQKLARIYQQGVSAHYQKFSVSNFDKSILEILPHV